MLKKNDQPSYVIHYFTLYVKSHADHLPYQVLFFTTPCSCQVCRCWSQRCRAVPGTSTCSATSSVSVRQIAGSRAAQDVPPMLSLSLRNICFLEGREFPPKLMFYFPFFLLDLNLAYLLTQTYSVTLCVNFSFEPGTQNLTQCSWEDRKMTSLADFFILLLNQDIHYNICFIVTIINNVSLLKTEL